MPPEEAAQVHLRGGHVGQRLLGCDEFAPRAVERGAIALRDAPSREIGQCTRGFDPYQLDRVGQQRRRVGESLLHGNRDQRRRGRRAHQRVRVVLRLHAEATAAGAEIAREVERRRAHDRRLRAIGDDAVETAERRRRAAPRRRERGGERRLLPPVGPEPLRHRVRRPLRRLLVVAAVARVGRAERHRQVRARNAEAVVGTRVDHHVVLRRHVATLAPRARTAGDMVMVRRRVVILFRERRKARIAGRLVTLRAQRVALRLEPQRMRVVAIGAAHALRVHPALQERAPDVDLLVLLAVGEVKAFAQQRRMVVVEERLAGLLAVGQALAARMAGRAGVDLVPRIGAAKIDGEPQRARGKPFRLLARRLLRPRDVRAAGPVARLAADIHFGPFRVVAVGLRVVVAAQVRRMAFRAHQVPVLVPAHRVQRVVGPVPVVRVEREPALAPRCPTRSSAPAGGLPARRPGIAAAAPRRTCTRPRTPRACRRGPRS